MLPVLVPLLFLLAYFGAPSSASAQQIRSLTLRFDNDILAVRGTGAPPDYDYTHGLHLGAEFTGLPGPVHRRLDADASDLRSHMGIGQRIYTPRQDGSEPLPGERPYAGWLFLDAGVVLTGFGIEHHLGLEVGVTGPTALGEPVQNGFHRLVGSTLQEGWEHQLRREVAGLVRYATAATHRLGRAHLRSQGEIALGTLWSGAATEVDVRFGSAPGARGLYAGAGSRQEWVARNLFLDGNTFRPSVEAERGAG